MQQLEEEGNRPQPSSSLPFNPRHYLPAICVGFQETSSPSKTAPVQTDKVNIAMGFDAGYAIHSLTTLASLFGTTKSPQNLEIYLLHPGKLPKALEEQFLGLPPSPKQIHFISMDDKVLHKLPLVNEHITLASYYRLLLPELIKQSKILWIDGDTLICDDIAALWQEDLTGFAFAAVSDLSEKEEKERLSDFYRTVKKDDTETYINSGVSLYNLDLIREIYPNLLKACQECIAKHPQAIQTEDQDLLNLLFVGRIKRLPLRWNLYSSFLHSPRYVHYFSDDEVREAVLNPGLIHYASPWNKPWKAGVRTRTKGLYWYWRHTLNLPPRGIKERIAKMFSPCYYVQKNNHIFLQISFGHLPWFNISITQRKPHLGKWKGFFR